jgi:hypothetical protein
MLRESALGLVCERLTVELRQSNFKDMTNEVNVTYDNMIVFLSTPVSPYSAFDHRIRRLDLISICGRTEMDPCIPITINCKRFSTLGSSSDPNVDGGRILAESLFPRVPSLSSYKARQEDDDETTSKATDLDVKLSDPQSAMLLNLTNANMVVSIHVPVVVIDVSAPELLEIEKLIRYADEESKPTATVTTKSQNDFCLACSLTSETVSVYLHADNSQSNESTFVLTLEDIKAHCLVDQASKHLRWLVHDFDFLESKFSVDLLLTQPRVLSHITISRFQLYRLYRTVYRLHQRPQESELGHFKRVLLAVQNTLFIRLYIDPPYLFQYPRRVRRYILIYS